MKARTPRYLKVGVVRVAIVTLLVFALLYQFSRGDESSNHLRQSSVAVQHESRREFFRTLALHHSPDQRQVVDMAKHAWKGYRRWGDWSDYLDVTRKEPGTAYSHDLALTAVDALDTLFILGLHDEFDEASAWVKANLDDTMFYPGVVSFFEVTIRSLGGLLSAYYLSGERHFAQLAIRLAHSLMKGFTCGSSPHNVPCHFVDLVTGNGMQAPALSEATTFLLEFSYVARTSGNQSFLEPVESVCRTMIEIVEEQCPDGIIPVAIDWDQLRPTPSIKTMDGLGDSYYEYLLKQWVLSGKQDDRLRAMYLTAVDGMQKELLGRSHPSNWTFVGEVSASGEFEPKMGHLTCFVPGLLALGVLHGMPQSHLELATALMETCVLMYLQSHTGLAPEHVYFNVDGDGDGDGNGDGRDMYVLDGDDYYLLRPETVESLMVLHRVTGDDAYRGYGRAIMNAIERNCKLLGGGYHSLRPVFNGPGAGVDNGVMESYFLAETLKYLFLLFSDARVLPLDAVVFNTEAHPLPIARP